MPTPKQTPPTQNPNAKAAAPAQKAATPPAANPATTAAKDPNALLPLTGEKSLAKLAEYKTLWTTQQNNVMRVASKPFLQQLVGKKLSWSEYCDLKIKAYSDHWNAKKINPDANKVVKPLTDAQKAKKAEEVQKLEEKIKKIRSALALPTAATPPAANPAATAATTESPKNFATNNEQDGEDDEEEE